jgi:GNAT superfamily N-acetyltransferase
MTEVTIEAFETAHRAWAQTQLEGEIGSVEYAAHSVLYNLLEHPGYVALLDGQPGGLLIYHVDEDQFEVLLTHSTVADESLGAALVKRAAERARELFCERMWVVITNDNIPALRFYQMQGFSLVKVHRNAVRRARKLKPDIPKKGLDGIPLRDEIELEMMLV